jgi:hypothetical protein
MCQCIYISPCFEHATPPFSPPTRSPYHDDPVTRRITTIIMTAMQVFTVLAGIVGVVALAIYLFGIPPELKRKMERQALKTMGENKMSYMAKGEFACHTASLPV